MSEFTQGKWEYADFVHDGVTFNGKEYIIFTKSSIPDNKAIHIALAKREEDARLIAAAPDMLGLICVLLHDDILTDTPRYRALSRARRIVERVNGTKINWPISQNETENMKGGETIG